MLAENVSNANTPNFSRATSRRSMPRGQPASSLAVARTSATHLAGSTTGPVQFQLDRGGAFEIGRRQRREASRTRC